MNGIPSLYKEATEAWMRIHGETYDDISYFWIENVHRWELSTPTWCYSPLIEGGKCWVRAIYQLN